MDSYHIDRLAVAIAGRHSRRGVLRAAVAGTAAALGIRGAGATGTCITDGRRCKRAHAGACCSGICGKRHGKRVCKPAPGAFGCTNLQNTCGNGTPIVCPGNTHGNCFVTTRKHPFCGDPNKGACFACTDDKSCVDQFGAGFRCMVCSSCSSAGNRVCLTAAPAP